MIPSSEDIVKCKKCGFFSKGKLTSKEKEEIEKKGGGVIKDEDIYASYPHKCKKCGFGKAEMLSMGPWYSDEDTVVQYKCGKCGFAENMSRKTS